ncbi:MAG: hypothetical protein HC920_17120 [Oscillatoriales cyanobacterium SM2_3_0]|nr:hypothetical protein [Oscillatoriales cyanobacterium SM2_3_0]
MFTAKGRSRTYQILTRPHGAQSAVILKIQSQPRQVFPQSELNELGLESLEEIEQMAKGKSKKQMTPEQIGQIKAAIEASLRAREHTRNPRTSTKNDHETALSRKRREQWSRAQRIFQTQGFGAALADMRR